MHAKEHPDNNNNNINNNNSNHSYARGHNNNNNNNNNSHRSAHNSTGSIYTGSVLLMEAILRRRSDVVDYLISNAPQLCLNLNSRDKTGSNILFYAASVGGVDDLSKLIEAGCQVESDYEGRTVLMQAALSGRVDTARFLVLSSKNIGLRVEQRDSMGRNALFYGVESNSLEMVEYLFSIGVSCHPTEGNTTVLMQSARAGNDLITRFLLEHSGQLNTGDINTSDFRGETALFYAVQSCSTSVVAVLVQNGADPLRENADGVNVVSYAMNNAPHLLAVSILEEAVPLDQVGSPQEEEVDKSREENFDSKRHHFASSDEFPVRGADDSYTSSRCSSSSSSGVCSTCSLYNNKSNSSNDELCGCSEEFNNNNNNNNINSNNNIINNNNRSTAKISSFNNDEQLPSDSKQNDSCELCCSCNQDSSLKFSHGLSFAQKCPLPSQPRDDKRMTGVKGNNARETTCHHSPECQTQDLNDLDICLGASADDQKPVKNLSLLRRLLWSKDNRSRSLIQYLIEAGEAKLTMAYLKVLEDEGDEGCMKKLRIEVDEAGCSLLMSACKQPLEEMTSKSNLKDQKFMKNGAKWKRRNETQTNRLDLVRYLVEVIRIDPHGVDKGNRNALFYAVESGSLQVTSYILQKMKTIEPDKTGRTILMVAVATGNQLVVSEILASKFAAELLTARDEEGRTAFHFCSMQDCSVQSAVMLDTLLKYEESLRKERLISPGMEANNFLEKPNFPDSSDFEGRTPLMYACQSGNRSAVMRLLRTPHVLPDRRDVKGRTALHHCFSGANASLFCAGSLLRRNVDVNATDVDGVTCLMLACQSCSVTNIPVVRMLVEFGADSVLQDAQGRDSFDYCPPINTHYVKAILRDKTCMPASEREALWQMEQRLTEELHMNSVLRGLLKEGIFTKTLNFEVMKQPPAERVQKLIEILVTRGRTAFRKFCKVLRQEGQLDTSFELMRMAYVKEPELFW